MAYVAGERTHTVRLVPRRQRRHHHQRPGQRNAAGNQRVRQRHHGSGRIDLGDERCAVACVHVARIGSVLRRVQAALSPLSIVGGVFEAAEYLDYYAANNVISIPSYDINLFLGGIGQAVSGDPFGLINSVADPIAADVGLLTVLGGIEGQVLAGGAFDVVESLLAV